MNSLSLPIVHPAFQNLKRSGRFLHFAAGSLITAHAISQFNEPGTSPVYLGCLLLIALDIFILVFAGKNILTALPKVNLFFRVVEILFFLGIGVTSIVATKWLPAGIHILLSIGYSYLFYCEKKLTAEEQVAIFHTGINIPALPESKFLIWSKINTIEAHYDSITISTPDKSYHFDLQKNLAFEELDQIHEFCRHYLGSSN